MGVICAEAGFDGNRRPRLPKRLQWFAIRAVLVNHHRFLRTSFTPEPISTSALCSETGLSQSTIWRRFDENYPGGWDAYSRGEIFDWPRGFTNGKGYVDAYVDPEDPELD